MAGTAMTIDEHALLKLMTWLSPAFPVGAFSYSSGLEWAVREGGVTNAVAVEAWLADILDHGTPWSDAILFAEAWRVHGEPEGFAKVTELARALAPSAERLLETTQQGAAFAAAAMAWNRPLPLAGEEGAPSAVAPKGRRRMGEERGRQTSSAEALSSPASRGPFLPPKRGRTIAPYPVAVGALAGRHGIPLEAALAAFLHALVSNAVSAAIRLVPLGQSEGVAILAGLAPAIAAAASRAANSSLGDLGSCAFMGDIATMKHETLEPRLFRT
jgi:urease accessory protein